AQMILDEGNWGLPRLFDQHLELQKPPLFYWLVALVAKCGGGGVDVWAVRLPAALSGLGCVFGGFFFGWKHGPALAGFLAGLILATSMHFTWLARVGRIDMPLTFTVTSAVGCFWLGQIAAAQGRRGGGYFALGFVAVGLGILLKGPIALVFAFGITG